MQLSHVESPTYDFVSKQTTEFDNECSSLMSSVLLLLQNVLWLSIHLLRLACGVTNLLAMADDLPTMLQSSTYKFVTLMKLISRMYKIQNKQNL